MRVLVASLLLVSMVLSAPVFDSPDYDLAVHAKVFRKWKNHFGKKYHDVAKEAKRFVIFMENWKFIHRHNTQANSTYSLGLNQFADLTADEFKIEVHGHSGSCLQRGTPPKKTFDPALAIVSAPASVDWTTKGVVTPVKNQGQCGSCWAFSTTGSIESRVAISTGKLVSLSEQQLVDCSRSFGNQGCNGGLMDNGFKYVKSVGGLCSESEYPYTARDGTCQASSCGQKYDAITGYVDVSRDSTPSMEAAVAAGPVSIAIEADQSAFQFYRGGVLTGACGTKLDHGVLAVGYGSDGGQDYWKVKNSWGASWGESGYIRLCKDCSKNGGAGECGLMDQPSYPTV